MTLVEFFQKVGRIPAHIKFECGYLRIVLFRIIAYVVNTKPHVWLFIERGIDAQDNAWHLFKYMVNNHPEIPVRFAILKKSPDFEANLKGYEQYVVSYDSYEYYQYLFHAKVLVSTHVDTFTPNYCYSQRLRVSFFKFKAKIIFLQHGIINQGTSPEFVYPQYDIDLFICGAKTEYEILEKYLNYPAGHLVYTGLARYDNLLDNHTKKQILVMPTWRKIYNHIDDASFARSGYFKSYSSLLSDERLKDTLRNSGYILKFYPHYEFQKYIHLFDSLNNDVINVMKFGEQRVQDLLKESAILVTDYSSIFFDFMYMAKPLIFYHFDIEKFQATQYGKCHYNYPDLGKEVFTSSEVVDYIISLLDSGCALDEKYKNMTDRLFVYRDTNNCQRIYDNIVRILNEK